MESSGYIITQIKRSDEKNMFFVQQLLHENGLKDDEGVTIFVGVFSNGQLIACGGLADNIIKCVAVAASARCEGVMLVLVTELINIAYDRQKTHLFLYTKAIYENVFKGCGFHTLATVPGVMVLMENSAVRIQNYMKSLAQQRREGQKIGSIVMNANPFTLGHLHLIKQAVAQCDWLHLFLVKENASQFLYEDRLEMVRRGTQGIPKLTVHEGSEYIISRATFPCYFLKEIRAADRCYVEIDIKIFRRFIAPPLGITHRYVGTEPLCALTASYNRGLRYWLKTKSMLPTPPIVLVEIERLRYAGVPISASLVRAKLAENDFATIASLVPRTTLEYLQNMQRRFHANDAP